MNKFRTTIALMGLGLLTLSACGPLSIQVEPLATGTPTSLVKPTLAPTLLASPTLRAITATPQPSATPASSLHLKPGTTVRIVSLHMLSVSNGWAIAETDVDAIQRILTTANGGQAWQDKTPEGALVGAPTEGLSAAAYFSSGSEAWSVYTSRAPQPNQSQVFVWHTTDSGASWEKSQPLDLGSIPMEFQYPSDLGFLDAQHGWVMMHLGVGMSHDYFAAFSTADGGKTWQRVLDPDKQGEIQSCPKSGFTFTTPASGWIAGNCPGLMPKLFFYHTLDSGATWAETTLPVPDGKAAGYYAQSSIGCGLGGLIGTSGKTLTLVLTCTNYNNNTAQAWLYATSDDGASWTQHPLPVANLKLDLISSDEAFLVGSASQDSNADGAVYHTTTGGSSWNMATSTAWQGTPDFIDSLNGWVIAQRNQVTALVRSLDGGRTWAEIKPSIGN